MSLTPKSNQLLFLPLGGTGEIGMNMNLYGHDGAWLMVDIGVTFGNDDFPEYEVLSADPAFIQARRDALAGIVLTHGHEDHLGALHLLWRRLRCPVYATPFTAALARAKLAAAGVDDAPLVEVRIGDRVSIGPFTVELIAMTHSIPEPNALRIETPLGAVLHTGDWKLDHGPVVGRRYDRARLRSLRRDSLLAVVCDSTNTTVAGSTAFESSLHEPLLKLAQRTPGRLVVTTFASNVARLVTLARIAQRTGRRFALVGQSLERIVSLARATGYWPEDLPALVDAAHVGYLPREEVLAVCTGCQGEQRAALARIASDEPRDLTLDAGDTVVFSSRLIPGNEERISRVVRQLRALGVEIVTGTELLVHVSGHPARDDLRRLYEWVQPPVVIPVHGTPRHLRANAAVAEACHVPQVHVIRNGVARNLVPGAPHPPGEVETGRLARGAEGGLAPVPAAVLAAMRAQGVAGTRAAGNAQLTHEAPPDKEISHARRSITCLRTSTPDRCDRNTAISWERTVDDRRLRGGRGRLG